MHIGFILDGNRRWATQKGFKTAKGHQAGAKNFAKILKVCHTKQISVVTAYILSSENFKNRTEEEKQGLFKLLEELIANYSEDFHKNKVKLKTLGDLSVLPVSLQKKIQELEKISKNYPNRIVQICINYGGRDEVLTAVNRILAQKDKNLTEIDKESFEKYLDSALEPDLIIRTGGYNRVSNFLLWQAAYSEYYFTDTLWPDFGEDEFNLALEKFNQTKRNFGR